MSIVVYWLEPAVGDQPAVAGHALFADDELMPAMALVEAQRRAGMAHVSLSTDFSHHVGKPGVDAVEQGRTPDGQDYEWSKAGRAGRMRRR
jgi:hypothetical protein